MIERWRWESLSEKSRCLYLPTLQTHMHARTEDHWLPTRTHMHTHLHTTKVQNTGKVQTHNLLSTDKTSTNTHAHTHNGNFIQHLLGVNESVCCQATYTHTRLQVSDRRHLHTDSSDRLPSSCHGNEYH